MNIAAKAFIGVVCAGGVGLTGCYIGGVWSEIPYVSLSEEQKGKTTGEQWSGYGSNIGKSYGIYFAAVYGNEKDVDTNRRWWERSYKSYKRATGLTGNAALHQDFAGVNSAYAGASYSASGNSKKFLNRVCENVYKSKSSSDVNFEVAANGQPSDAHKLGRDLLKYCSPLGAVPRKLSERADVNSKYQTGIGKDKKAELADFEGNDVFWSIKQKQFEGDKASMNTNLFFKEYIEASKPIRKICEIAYGKTKVNGESAQKDQPKEDEIVKYCSFTALTS